MHMSWFFLCRNVGTGEENGNDQQEERNANASEANQVDSQQDQHINPYV